MDVVEELRIIIESLSDRLETLEHTVNDTIIGGLKSAAAEYEDNDRFEQFSGKYGPSIEEFSPKMKILCGDDYDLCRELYDALKEAEGYGSDDFDEEGLMNGKLQELREKFAAIDGCDHVDADNNGECDKCGAEVDTVKVEDIDKDEEDFPSDDELMEEAKAIKLF